MTARVPFVDFGARVRELRPEIDAALARVLDSGWFILGPEVEAFERELAAALGVPHAVAVGNGTDALQIALLAPRRRPGRRGRHDARSRRRSPASPSSPWALGPSSPTSIPSR